VRKASPEGGDDHWWRVAFGAWVYSDPALTAPSRFHESGCDVDGDAVLRGDGRGRCTCRSPMVSLPVDLEVVLLRTEGAASLVVIRGHLPTWVETKTLVRTNRRVTDAADDAGVPPDLTAWIDAGSPAPSKRSKIPPKGGGLVLVRAEAAQLEPWRWIGKVRVGGKPHLLLVAPTVPLGRILDAAPDQVRTVPLDDRPAERVLVPLPVVADRSGAGR